MKNYIKLFAFAAFALSFAAVSCQKIEDDVFDEPSSARMLNLTENVRSILVSSEAGWVMDAYPGTAGACSYFLKFTDKDVTAWFEKDPSKSCTSLYSFRFDNGAVLAFDTYNNVLDYFATPSSAHYEAYAGDFEFTIMGYDNDKIRLLGKRSGLYHTLYRAGASQTPEKYLGDVCNIVENFRASTLEGKIGDMEVTGSVDLDMRTLSLTYNTEELKENEEGVMETVIVPVTKEKRFNFTPDGLRFYDEMEMNGYKFDFLWYLPENNILTNGVFTLQGKLPDDYMPYSAFEGNFTLTYNGKSVAVVLTPEEGGYVMSGINSNYVIHLTYDKSLGRLHWKSQVVGSNGSNTVYLCAWSLSAGGSLSWTASYGVTIHWVAENNQFEFEDNGAWSGKPVDSFILWEISSAGSSVGQFTGWGSSQIPYLQSLKRR